MDTLFALRDASRPSLSETTMKQAAAAPPPAAALLAGGRTPQDVLGDRGAPDAVEPAVVVPPAELQAAGASALACGGMDATVLVRHGGLPMCADVTVGCVRFPASGGLL